MLNHLIAFSLKNRPLVLIIAVLLVGYGGYRATQLPIDVFPDLNRPTVTVMTEAHGLAPEEVETLVTFPVESALNGASGVIRVRSASGIGISIIYVEFDWGTDIYKARQVVAEKLNLVRTRLPGDIEPVMTPISSIMGEILLVGMRSTGETSEMDVRTMAEWVVRPRILAVGGVAQVTVMGGELKQYQVLTSPDRLASYGVTLDELTEAVRRSNAISGGGFLMKPGEESLIRIVGRAESLNDIEQTVVRYQEPVPITIGQVADVVFGGTIRRGVGSVNAESAVILSVQKQPGADTLALTEQIEAVLAGVQKTLPADVEINAHIFQQATFIEAAIDNVLEAVRDGALWVVVILFVFLWNLRISLITLTAIPLSVVITALVFDHFGVSVNTMTLGGLAVAVGELVDDAIIDIENIYRRLKENRHTSNSQPPLKVILLASSEVRNSIVYATMIVVLVVLPLFGLDGLEGRMFAPLGLSYLLTLVASLLVSLTVTPVLASYLLPNARFLADEKDPWLLRGLKWADRRVLGLTLRHSYLVLGFVSLLVIASVASLSQMGGEFLPEFNEGTLTIAGAAPPGTSLEESDRLGKQIERALAEIPEVTQVSRRTGRAELDEHAENVNFSEIDVDLVPRERPLPGWHNAVFRAIPGLHWVGVEEVGRPRDEVLADVRQTLGEVPGVKFNIGQPISHRLDHIMSGIRAQVAVKLYGADLTVLRETAYEIAVLMDEVEGIVDLQIEPQVDIPQVKVTVNREAAQRYGLTPEEVAEALETAFQGRSVGQVLEGQRVFDLVVWFDRESRNDVETIRRTLLTTPSGATVSLGDVAEVIETSGPNTINREDVQRRIVVQANTAGRDLAGVVGDVKAAVESKIVPNLPESYFVQYGGQFEAQQQANQRLLLLASLAIMLMVLLLVKCLGSWTAAAIVMTNVPLAAIGSVIALLITNWPDPEALAAAQWWQVPQVWVSATTLSVAHWVGFITLTGIVARNGIMMITHYQHLMRYEGETFTREMITRGSLERLGPVLMTALATTIGLVPLAMGAGETGKEILHPLAIVVIGGLISSTLLDQLVTPALFWKFGRPVEPYAGREGDEDNLPPDLQALARQFDEPRRS